MSFKISGNTRSLRPSQVKDLESLFKRTLDPVDLISLDLAQELYALASRIGRRIGLLIGREGNVEEVVVGTREILYLPDLGRYRVGLGRLRRLRLIFSDLSKRSESIIPQDIYTDLEKLRLDTVCAVKQSSNRINLAYAYCLPAIHAKQVSVQTEQVEDLEQWKFDFLSFINQLETQHVNSGNLQQVTEGALLIGVYATSQKLAQSSLYELNELARTAGVKVLGEYIQRKQPDPKTLVGKGKLDELVLEALRLGANLMIFDTELKPSQWRAITNATDLKVIDRSMLILDIFAQRAKSSAGRLQVEHAQLKYNLPRLVELDAGLSRLTGGIGGRGPGETKLEIGRRRIRDRITRLEKMIDQLSSQRELLRSRRVGRGVMLAAILGYTNAGKSTLFNALTKSKVLAENKLFATLDTTQGKISVPITNEQITTYQEIVVADTVGFIRSLPKELINAFRATLEELNEADLLIHVMDAADQDLPAKYEAVMSTLASMDLLDIPIIHVLNKTDLLETESLQVLVNEYSAIAISAQTGAGFRELKEQIGNLASFKLDSEKT